MKLTDSQIKMMQEDLYAELIQIIMEKWNYPMEKAIETLYNSETFSRLQDPTLAYTTKVPDISIPISTMN